MQFLQCAHPLHATRLVLGEDQLGQGFPGGSHLGGGYLSRGKEHYTLGPGKTRTHCGGNIVCYDVAPPWQDAAKLWRAARTQEMFLKIF